jgi:arsenate reductase
MKNLLIWYPKCSTCQKAKKYLEANNIAIEERHIVEDTPSKEELGKWIKQSGLETKKFFNTSGLKYKELNLKEKLPTMTEKEKIELLASNGMLIKRPLFISKEKVLVGFKEKEWREIK